MTCIVGLKHGNTIYMGADSAGVDERYLMLSYANKKVFKVGEFVIGYTTSFRFGQVMQYGFNPPMYPEGMDVYEYMVTLFVDALRERLKDAGYAQKKDEVESGGTCLVGYRGRLFLLSEDYQVFEARDEYMAVGCGDEIALGAMYATSGTEPVARILKALEASAKFSAAVLAPFEIMQTESEEADHA